MSDNDSKIIVAMDFSSADSALAFVDTITPDQCKLKIGKELFTSAGPELVRKLVDKGYDIFLDLKFHDIPNTVKRAVAASAELGVWMVNIHALGGGDMIRAACEGLDSVDGRKPKLIAVTILTSMNQQGLDEIGIGGSLNEQVMRLAEMSIENGVDGLVCSAMEAPAIRQQFGYDPLLVTPGIRPAGSIQDDQQRIMTPLHAMEAGASYLVIGRPITTHPNPALQLQHINESLQ